jgi:sulfide:quinone oxidoreductase
MSIRVLIAGGGVVGLETALALQAYADRATEREVVDVRFSFELPAHATPRAFGWARHTVPLSAVAARGGFHLRHGAVSSVAADDHLVITGADEAIGYDRLVLAVGARHVTSIASSITFGAPRDVFPVQRLLAGILRDARRGAVTELVFVVPPRCGWPLPGYELALATARRLERRGVRDAVRITLVTAEKHPLEVFGAGASAAVADDLRDVGITTLTGAVASEWSGGRLHLRPAGSVAADRVVSLPSVRGPGLAGIPSDAHGFIRTDRSGRVVGLEDVFAVGDAADFPVKQGGVGCQHADTVAALIAAQAGYRPDPPADLVLRAQLWDDERGRALRAVLIDGRATDEGTTWRTAALWPWHRKIACRFLSPVLEDLLGPPP